MALLRLFEQIRLDTIISDVPQCSIFGPTFYIFFSDFFFFISKASVHNFADDNTLASFASTLKEFLPILESEFQTAMNWLPNNKMILNPDTFQVFFKTGNKKIKSTSSVKLREVHIDDKLSLSHHINKLGKSVGNQLKCSNTTKVILKF